MPALALTILDMDDPQYMENLRASAHLATRHHKKTAMANKIGCARQTLSTFLAGGPLGPEFRSRLETWLKENNYWNDVREYVTVYAPFGKTAQRAISAELRSLAGLIESPLPDEIKAQRFEDLVLSYAKNMESLRRRILGDAA